MVFVETPIFTHDVQSLLDDKRYSELQAALADRPEAGDLIRGTGGLRKLRWSLPGKGKSGGIRVIYYWRVSESQILMLAIYPKSARDDLTETQKKMLRKIVEGWR